MVRISYHDSQVACLKQNTHINKMTNHSCHINAVAILLANFIMWVFVFMDNQPKKDGTVGHYIIVRCQEQGN